MIPKKKANKTVMACTSCNHVDEKIEASTMKETIKKEDVVDIVDQDQEQHLPLTDEVCPECNHPKAYFWLVQTRASDEAATKFLRCEKCLHTWRDYN